MNLLSAPDCLVTRDPVASERVPADLRVEHFVRPVVIMEVRREIVTGSDSGLVLEPLSRFGGHQGLLDGVEHRLPLLWRRVKIEA